MLHIDFNLRAMVLHSNITGASQRDGHPQYILGPLFQDAYPELEFPGRKRDIVLPEGTPVDVVVLAHAELRQVRGRGNEYIDRLVALVDEPMIYGVRVDEDSPFFDNFRLKYFSTGVVYDASEKRRVAYFAHTTAPMPEARLAHKLLYQKTRSTVPLPKGLSLRDLGREIHWRTRLMSTLVSPPNLPSRITAEVRLWPDRLVRVPS